MTFTERLPQEYHRWRQVEVDGPTAEPMDDCGHRLGSARVAVGYFEVLGGEITAGRGFRLSDLGEGQRVVVVNESFVEKVMGGRNPVGQRIRYLATEEYRDPSQEPGPWHEIVGVVEDLGTVSGYGHQGMYHLAELTRGQREFYTFWSTILGAVSGLAILLSMGGIFAVMSFTMARRTREIGIRVALGASSARVIAAVFRKPLTQVALGLLAGAILLTSLMFGLNERTPDFRDVAYLLGYVSIIGAICLLACIPPTRRALAVEPAEALRVDG